jgi:hypothetical protein
LDAAEAVTAAMNDTEFDRYHREVLAIETIAVKPSDIISGHFCLVL